MLTRTPKDNIVTPEELIKKLIGDQAFTIAVLQAQVIELQKKLAEKETSEKTD